MTRSYSSKSTSPAGRALLAGAMCINFGAALLPLCVIGLMLSRALLAQGLVGDMLRNIGALSDGSFQPAWWIGTVGGLLFTAFSLIRHRFKHPHAWRPLIIWTACCALGLTVLLPLERFGGVDLPDLLLSSLAIGGLTTLAYAGALILAATCLRWARRSWREGTASPAQLSAALQRHGFFALLVLLVYATVLLPLSPGRRLQPKKLWAATAEWVEETWLPAGPDALQAQLARPGAQIHTSGSGPIRKRGDARGAAVSACLEDLSQRLWANGERVLKSQQDRLIRRGINRADAEDLVFNALLRICEKDARTPLDDRAQYFAKSVSNGCKDLHAGRRRRGFAALDEQQACPSTFEALAESEAQLTALHAALRACKPEQREVLTQRYFRKLSYEKIAERLGEKAATIRKRGERALACVRQNLEKSHADLF